jgi:hypothetical protein
LLTKPPVYLVLALVSLHFQVGSAKGLVPSLVRQIREAEPLRLILVMPETWNMVFEVA